MKLDSDQASKLFQCGFWTILRHGGRSSDEWKRRYVCNDESEALSAFDGIKDMMRQGGLAMLSTTGEVVRYYEAPRLRSRW